MFVAYLRTFERMGLKSIPMRADTGPIGGNLSHEFIILASTGESEDVCHKDYLDFPVPSADTDFDDAAGHRQPSINGLPLCGDIRKCTTSPPMLPFPMPRRCRRAVSRSAYLLFRHEIFRADGSNGHWPGWNDEAGSYGLLWHRPLSPCRSPIERTMMTPELSGLTQLLRFMLRC